MTRVLPEAGNPGPEVAQESLACASTEDLVALARLSLGEGRVPRTPEFWEWKHAQNPFGRSLGRAARAANHLAGMRAFMRWRWRAGDRRYLAVRAVDTATHPAWRRRGIFRRLTEAALEDCAREGIGFVFNTPNKKSLPGYLKMGWTTVGRIELRVRPLRWRRGLRRGLLAQVGRTWPLPAQESSSDAASVLRDPGIGELLGTNGGDRRLYSDRDVEYLRWRYCRVPGLSYHAALVPGPSGALIVYRVRQRHGLAELMVCELIVRDGPDSEGAAARLLRRVVVETDADYAVAIANADTPEARVLRQVRFFRVPRLGPILTVRRVNDSACPPALERMDSWRFSVGDIELF